MRFRQYLLICTPLLLNACSDSTSNDVMVEPPAIAACEGDVYISGTVEREFTDTTWNEPFIATDSAHIHIDLVTFLFDGPSTTLLEREVNFTDIPFTFSLCGDTVEIEAMRDGHMAVGVEIYNHVGSGGRVGDLVSEYLNEVQGPTTDMAILVSGLEHCDSPNAGGFCTTNE